MKKEEENKDFPGVVSAVILMGLLIGIEMIVAVGFYDAGISFKSGDPRASVITVLGFGAVLSFLLGYKKLSYGELFNPSAQSARALGALVIPVLMMSAGLMLIVMEITNILVYFVPLSEKEFQAGVELLSSGLASMIALILVAPFIEEMLFRGIFLRAFLQNYSPRSAIFFSALLFGFAHLNIYQFVVATLFGLLTGWLYYATGSLWPSIMTHAFYNGGVYWHAQCHPESLSRLAQPPPLHPAPVLAVAVAALVLGGWWAARTVRGLQAVREWRGGVVPRP